MNNSVAANLPKEMQSHHYPILYQVEDTHWWYVGRRRIIQSLVEKICETLNNPSPRLLDVGCGTGANLKMLAAHGRAEGVDISPQAVEFCRERGLDSVRLGAAEQLPYENDSFELVTALDVIEHLDDDVAGLREMRRVLRRDGRILIFVPAFMFLWGVQDDISNRRRRYTLAGIKSVLQSAGFQLERATYANMTFFLPILLGCLLMRATVFRPASENNLTIGALNGPLGSLFGTESAFLRYINFPFGVS